MNNNLIVPQVHVERQFIVYAFYKERRHVAYDALQRTVNIEFRQEQIRIRPVQFSCLFVTIMLHLALDTCNLAAFMCIWI